MAKKIMLVEDDNNLREIYEARLTAEGYEIVAAENGEAALAMAAKVRPDMIISDVMMPKISGFEMLDILRNTDGLKNTKIIMLTALGQAEDSQRANNLGADRYLVKSQVTLEDIVKAAHDLLDDEAAAAPDAQPASGAAGAVAPEAAAEPAAPVVEPVVEPTPVVEPAVEPAAAAPTEPAIAVAPEPAAAPPENIAPVAAPEPEAVIAPTPGAQASQTPPAADQPVVEPAAEPSMAATPEPAAVVEPAEAPVEAPVAPGTEPAAAPPVISIPISDGDDGAVAPADSTATTDSDAAVADPAADPLSVMEPAATPDMVVTEPAPAEQPAPTEAIQDAEAIQEPPAPEASAIEAQINEFINNQASQPVVTDDPASETTSETPTADPATPVESPEAAASDQPAQPSIEIPSIVAEPTVTSDTDLPANVEANTAPADDVPAPEELDSFSAPVIDAPEGQAVPEPQDMPVPTVATEEVAPEAAPESPTVEAPPLTAQDNNADQLREAAEDLAAGTTAEEEPSAAADPQQPVSSNATNRMRNISPISGGEVKPDINQLLALEEAKNGALQAAQATESPRPNVDAYTPSAQAAPAPSTPPIDPNSISL